MTRKTIRSIIEYLFFLGIGFLLLWLGFRKLDLNEIWNDILKANYMWLVFALIFALTSHIIRALRWNLLINALGYKTRLSSTFFAVMIGYMANTAVPRMGEFARCGVLSRKEKIPVISERVFDLIVLALIIFSVIIFQLDLVSEFLNKYFGPLLDKIFSNMISIVVFSTILLVIIAGVLYLLWIFKTKIKSFPLYQPIRNFIDGLWNGIKTIKKMKQKWLFLFYTAVIWLFYAIMTYLPFMMLSETSFLTFLDGITLMAIASLGIVAPVPGGIGAYHYLAKVSLTELYAVEANAAMSYATIAHAGQTIMNVVIGALSYLFIGIFSKRQKPLNE